MINAKLMCANACLFVNADEIGIVLINLQRINKDTRDWLERKPLKRRSQLQQTTNFAKSFPIFEKIRYAIFLEISCLYFMKIVCQTILLKYHVLFFIFEKAA